MWAACSTITVDSVARRRGNSLAPGHGIAHAGRMSEPLPTTAPLPAPSGDRAEPLALYEFETVGDLLIGWQVHAARQWRIHADSAHRFTLWHHLIGVPAVALTALAGTTAATSHTTLASYLAAAATVLVAVQTFLNFGARADTNRLAGAGYKRLVRRLEQIPPTTQPLPGISDRGLSPELSAIATQLAEADAAAPAPSEGIVRAYAGRGFAMHTRVQLRVADVAG